MKLKIIDDFEKMVVSPDVALLDVIRAIETGMHKTALVLDDDGILVGVITDADVRRALLRGLTLQDPIVDVINVDPYLLHSHQNPAQMLNDLMDAGRDILPIIDEKRRAVAVVAFAENIRESAMANEFIVIAGGLGSRLRPYTNEVPKPLLKVGGQPILATILGSLSQHGFRKGRVSVNYLGEQIMDFCGSGEQWGLDISYIQETEPLGTAGPLSLMEKRPSLPFLVTNSDVLTRLDYRSMLRDHEREGAIATVATVIKDFEVPYGVIQHEKRRVLSIEEKPAMQVMISAGVYIFSPRALDFMGKGARKDIPDLLDELIEAGERVNIFPINDYWIDIGTHQTMQHANNEFSSKFGEF